MLTPQPSILPKEAPAWSFLLDSQPCAALWTLLHAIDSQGSGVVTFRVAEVAKILKRTHQTIRDQLKVGQRSQWFRAVLRVKPGIYRVFLAAHLKVAERLGLETLGPAAWVPLDRLCDPRRLAVDVAAEEYQECSRRARIKELRDGALQDPGDRAKRGPSGKRGKINSPDFHVPTAYELLTDRPPSTTSESSTGGNADNRSARQQPLTLGKGDRNVYVPSYVQVTGVSQDYLGSQLGRSVSTVRRRLSNELRQRLDRPTIMKRQVCQEVRRDGISCAQHLGLIVSTGRSTPELRIDSDRYFMSRGKLWYACTNLYYLPDSHHCRQRRKRGRYKKLCERYTEAVSGALDL